VQDFSCLIDDTSYCIKISSSFHESRTTHDTPVYAIFRARLFLVIAPIVTALALLYNCYGGRIIFPQRNARVEARRAI